MNEWYSAALCRVTMGRRLFREAISAILDNAPKRIANKSVPPRDKYAGVAFAVSEKTNPMIKPCVIKLKSR